MNTPEARLAWAREKFAQAGARLTSVREQVITLLAMETLPLTWESVAHAEDITGRYDATTVYRTLMFLLDLEIVRQLHFQDRASYFVLNAPDARSNYLVCRCCGVMTALPPLEETHLLERQVSATHGYTALQHDVIMSGFCPVCQKTPHTCAPPSKLRPRSPKQFRPGPRFQDPHP